MATTTNYGWTTPDDTALVKDGASAIRTLGSSVDTTTKALNPSTTLGDIEYRSSTANTNTRLGIGSTGNVLTVAGGVPTWAAPGGAPGKSYSLLNAGGTSLTGATTITISSISGMENFLIQVNGASASANSTFYLRINGSSSGGLYLFSGQQIINGTTYSTDTFGVTYTTGTDGIYLAQQSSAAGSQIAAGIQIDGGTSTGYKSVSALTGANLDGGSGSRMVLSNGIYKGTATISSISLFSDNGNFDAGTIYVYASA